MILAALGDEMQPLLTSFQSAFAPPPIQTALCQLAHRLSETKQHNISDLTTPGRQWKQVHQVI